MKKILLSLIFICIAVFTCGNHKTYISGNSHQNTSPNNYINAIDTLTFKDQIQKPYYLRIPFAEVTNKGTLIVGADIREKSVFIVPVYQDYRDGCAYPFDERRGLAHRDGNDPVHLPRHERIDGRPLVLLRLHRVGQENIVPASLQPRDDIARKAREERVVDGRDGQPHGISPPRPEALCNKVRGVPACPDLVLYFRYGGLAYPVTPALP